MRPKKSGKDAHEGGGGRGGRRNELGAVKLFHKNRGPWSLELTKQLTKNTSRTLLPPTPPPAGNFQLLKIFFLVCPVWLPLFFI